MAGLGCGAGELSQCTSSKTVLIATIKTVRYTRNCMIARFFVPLRNETPGMVHPFRAAWIVALGTRGPANRVAGLLLRAEPTRPIARLIGAIRGRERSIGGGTGTDVPKGGRAS